MTIELRIIDCKYRTELSSGTGLCTLDYRKKSNEWCFSRQCEKPKGIGNAVAYALQRLHVTMLLKSLGLGNCGCDERKKRLNQFSSKLFWSRKLRSII